MTHTERPTIVGTVLDRIQHKCAHYLGRRRVERLPLVEECTPPVEHVRALIWIQVRGDFEYFSGTGIATHAARVPRVMLNRAMNGEAPAREYRGLMSTTDWAIVTVTW